MNYTDMGGKKVTYNSDYDNKQITLSLDGRSLTFFYKDRRAHAYSTSGEVLNLVFTFPVGTVGFETKEYKEVWLPLDNNNDFQDIVISTDNTVYNPDGKMYLHNIWTANSTWNQPPGNGNYFQFMPVDTVFTVTSKGVEPIQNNITEWPKGYTYITSDTNQDQLTFYFKDDTLRPYNPQTQTAIMNMALTFPSVPVNRADASTIFKPYDSNNSYQKVSKTANGYIYNPASMLYFSMDSNGYINFTKEQPPPMAYHKGAWNDLIRKASTYGDDVVRDAKKYFSYVPGDGTVRDGVKTWCGYSDSNDPYLSTQSSGCKANQCQIDYGKGYHTCIQNSYDFTNKEKCINLDPSVITTPTPSDTTGKLPVGGGYIDSTKCLLSFNNMKACEDQAVLTADSKLCKVSGDSDNPNIYLGQNVAWFPFASGTANSNTIIEFCGSPDQTGKIRRNPSSTHEGCKDWANSKDGQTSVPGESLSPLDKSKIYTCKTFIGDYTEANKDQFTDCSQNVCIKDSGCNQAMTEFCKGDNLLKGVCIDYCKNSKSCDSSLIDYCQKVYNQTKDYTDPKYSEVCGCFYPQGVYDDFFNVAQDYAQSHNMKVPVRSEYNQVCFFPQCANATSIKPKDSSTTCPSITECIQSISIDANKVGNVTINPSMAGCNVNSLCNSPAKYNEKSGNCECPTGFSLNNQQCVCVPPKIKINDNTCVCPAGQVDKNGSCVPVSNCNPPFTVVNGICVCPSGQVLSMDGKDCLDSCPTGQAVDPVNNQCQIAPGPSPPGPSPPGPQPLRCPSGLVLSQDGKVCLAKCPDGQDVDKTTNQCKFSGGGGFFNKLTTAQKIMLGIILFVIILVVIFATKFF